MLKSLDDLAKFSPELLDISIYPDHDDPDLFLWVIDIVPFTEGDHPNWPWKHGLAGYGASIEEATADLLKNEKGWRK